jgi:hypothetical protein
VPLWVWLALVESIGVMLVVDLLLVHRSAHVITTKEASIEASAWISLGLAFGLVLLSWQVAKRRASITQASCSRRACPLTTCSCGR